jgi:hypothetical protein
LQASEDRWAAGDLSYFKTQEAELSTQRFNMFRGEEMSTQQVALTIKNENWRRNRVFHHLINPALTRDQITSQHKDITRIVSRYTEYFLRDGIEYTDPCDGILCYFAHSRPIGAEYTEDNCPIFIGFTWGSILPHIRLFTHLRQDVADAHHHMMALVYRINELYFRATIEPQKSTSKPHMTFNPIDDIFLHKGTPGHYVSNMKDLAQFFQAITYLPKYAEFTEMSHDFIKLCLIFDFMSFAAQRIRSLTDCGLDRSDFICSLQRFRDHDHSREFHFFHDVFYAIASAVKPTPVDPLSYIEHTPPATPVVSMMSASSLPPGLLSPGYPDSDDDDDDDDDDEDGPQVRLRALIDTDDRPSYPRNYSTGYHAPPASFSTKRSYDSVNIFKFAAPATKSVSFADDSHHKTIIDSGASTCGTGRRDTLKNLRPTSCTIVAAFGDTAQPTEMGDLPPFQLKTVVIDQMKDTTLLSVSQACQKDMVGIFTAVDCRFYDINTIIPYLSEISIHGTERLRGVVEDGLYVHKSS